MNVLGSRGLKPLAGTQCVYVHIISGLLIVALVDDFLVLGARCDLADLLRGLQAEYECSGKILGYDGDDVQELAFLGRSIRLVRGTWNGKVIRSISIRSLRSWRTLVLAVPGRGHRALS